MLEPTREATRAFIKSVHGVRYQVRMSPDRWRAISTVSGSGWSTSNSPRLPTSRAERFSRRLDQLSKGVIEVDRSDAVGFWTQIMGEHADFIVHLLDPEELALIQKAMKTSQAFRDLHDKPSSREEAVNRAVDDVIDFKTAAVKGVQTGQIKSIIHPTLADHVRREAVKCSDELRRSD